MNKFMKKVLANAEIKELYQYDKMILNEYMEQKGIKKNRESLHSFLLELYSNEKLTLGEFRRLYSLTK